MTTYLGKSCSFGLPRVPFVNCRQFMYLVIGSWMTTYLGKSCSFGLPRVPFVNCRQFMYLVISLLVLRAGCGIWLYHCLSFYFTHDVARIIYRNDTKYLDVKFWAKSVDRDLMGQGTDKVGIWWYLRDNFAYFSIKTCCGYSLESIVRRF